MELIKVCEGKWKFEVVHKRRSEIVTFFIYTENTEVNTYDAFDSEFLIKLVEIEKDAFAIKRMYIDRVVNWQKESLDEIQDYAFLKSLDSKGIDLDNLLKNDYLELLKWESEFEIDEINILHEPKTLSTESTFFMHAIVKDPCERFWIVRLGSNNSKYEMGQEGYIEYA
jgi:hypothetical protein